MLERVPEIREPHSQLLRVTLEADNARAYWQRVGHPTTQDEADRAFVEYWFGTKSMERVRDRPTPLVLPRVSAGALGYPLYLLRGVEFEGSLHANPYLRSVGLEGSLVDDRLRTIAGLTYRRIGDLSEITWEYESLADWVRHTRAAA
jgi:hypothetical protein